MTREQGRSIRESPASASRIESVHTATRACIGPARLQSSGTRSKNFGEISVELDAIEPNQLRALVQEAIELHLPPEQFEKLKAAEESEREIITRLVGKIVRKRLR